MHTARNFLQDQTGVASVEYAMLAALIALLVAIGAGILGQAICASFNGIGTALSVLPAGALTPVAC
jgi:pilus assembly protein Flp/PilA